MQNDSAILGRLFGQTEVVIKSQCASSHSSFSLSPSVDSARTWSIYSDCRSWLISCSSYPCSSLIMLIRSSFTSAKTTSYPDACRRSQINPRPILPAPKCTALLIVLLLSFFYGWYRSPYLLATSVPQHMKMSFFLIFIIFSNISI